MKKFTRILLCLVLCVFSVTMFACRDKRTDKEKAFTYPTTGDIHAGFNDGMAVQKGNYLYFVNGYISSTDNTKHIRYGSYHVGALMLAKFDQNGNLVTKGNGAIDDQYLITMSDKLSGFQATSLFIAGDYLYFTSTCQEDDNNETWAQNRVDFNRIKLDKTSEVERIYQSEVDHTVGDTSNLEFRFYNTSLIVWEKGTNSDDKKDVKTSVLYHIDLYSLNKTEVARNVKTAVFGDNDVFYVVDNNLNRLQSNGTNSNFVGFDSEVKVVDIQSDYVFAVYNSELKKYKISTKTDMGTVLLDYSTYDKVVITPDAKVVIAIGDNIIEYFANGSLLADDSFVEDEDTDKINFIGFANGCIVYYDDENTIKTVSYAELSSDINTVIELETMKTSYFDIDGSHLYYYDTVGSNDYLHRVKLDAVSPEAQLVGSYLQVDIPTT
ncbi:MAG: hypothetical protein IKM43_02110 [Clostridia bacterium]|nr:hypothetical protein [Clostridia bacterium]